MNGNKRANRETNRQKDRKRGTGDRQGTGGWQEGNNENRKPSWTVDAQ